MTKFEKDYKEAAEFGGVKVIERRKNEIKGLTLEGKKCKNKFKMQCIAEEIKRLKKELETIENLF